MQRWDKKERKANKWWVNKWLSLKRLQNMPQSYPAEETRSWDILHKLQPSLDEVHWQSNCPVSQVCSFLGSENTQWGDLGGWCVYRLGNTGICYAPHWCPKLQLELHIWISRKSSLINFPSQQYIQDFPKLLGELSQSNGVLPSLDLLGCRPLACCYVGSGMIFFLPGLRIWLKLAWVSSVRSFNEHYSF